MPSLWYVAACIVLPAVWGLTVGLIYDRLAARGKTLRPDDSEPPIYSDFEI